MRICVGYVHVADDLGYHFDIRGSTRQTNEPMLIFFSLINARRSEGDSTQGLAEAGRQREHLAALLWPTSELHRVRHGPIRRRFENVFVKRYSARRR